MIPIAAGVRIWIATGRTDMRKGGGRKPIPKGLQLDSERVTRGLVGRRVHDVCTGRSKKI